MAREITERDLANKGVSGLPDVPGLTTEAMQKKFDEISKELLVPRFNEMVQEVNGLSDTVNEVNSNLETVSSNLISMKTMGETEMSCVEYFINNVYHTLVVDTANIISGVFVNNQYVAYIGSKPDANFASFLFVGYGIRAMHVSNAGGNWQSTILNN